MARYRLLVLCAVCLLAVGCRPKPSKEFVQASGMYDVLTTRDGDDAYDAPEMATVVDLLNKVPPDSKNAAQATALLAKIDGEKKRIAAEKASARAAAQAANPAPVTPPSGSLFPSDPSAGTAAVNPAANAAAAVENPANGMTEADFTAKYAGCFEAGPSMLPPGATGTGTSQKLINNDACLKRFNGTAGVTTFFVFADGKLSGRAQQTESKVTTPGKPVLIPGKGAPPPPPPDTAVPGKPVYGVDLPKGAPGSPTGTVDSPTGTPPPAAKDPWQQ